MTAFLVYDYFKDGDATMSEAWVATKKNTSTIFYLAIISAVVNIILGILRGKTRRDRSVTGGLSGMIIGFIEKAWTVATYFMIPAIVVENRDLKSAVDRASSIIKRNLLPIGVGEIAVGLVTGFLSVIGFVIAIVIGISLAAVSPLIAILVAAILIVIIIALSMYVTTAYHTCLFLWARNVEDAKAGMSGTIKPPAPIAGALGIS